jgi:hypothetical protein
MSALRAPFRVNACTCWAGAYNGLGPSARCEAGGNFGMPRGARLRLDEKDARNDVFKLPQLRGSVRWTA